MLKRQIVLLGAMAVLAVLLSCRGEPSPAPLNTGSPPAALPTPTALDPATAPTATAATAPSPATATARPSATAVQVRLSPTDPPSTATAEPTEAVSREEEVAEIGRMVETYWGAFNDYDPDSALSMLEESYRALEDELIRSDIGRMKLFRVQLDVSEETPPTLNADGDYETYLSLKTPIDSRTVLMVFRRIDGQWQIVFSDELPE